MNLFLFYLVVFDIIPIILFLFTIDKYILYCAIEYTKSGIYQVEDILCAT